MKLVIPKIMPTTWIYWNVAIRLRTIRTTDRDLFCTVRPIKVILQRNNCNTKHNISCKLAIIFKSSNNALLGTIWLARWRLLFEVCNYYYYYYMPFSGTAWTRTGNSGLCKKKNYVRYNNCRFVLWSRVVMMLPLYASLALQ